MMAFFRTAKEWWLTVACLLLLVTQFFPQAIETVYPVLDFKGGNQYNMETDKTVYHCGEIVQGRFKFQKQRTVTGSIKWQLVSHDPARHITLFLPRVAASPILILDHWVSIEKLPGTCEPGQYHFEGTITYPGGIVYDLRTECFQVKP